jgi:hypothetical protein
MFWIAFTLVLSQAVLIDPEFVTADVTASGSDLIFAGFNAANEITVAVWVKLLSQVLSDIVIWEVKKSAADGAPSLTLRKQPGLEFTGCYSVDCKDITVQEGLFIWSYLVVSVKDTSLRVCQAAWSSRSTTCEEAALSAGSPLLGSDFEVKVYAQMVRFTQVELHSFELFNTYLSTQALHDKVLDFSCHSICTTCFGPAPNACNEFTALIGLDEVTIEGSDSLVIPATDVKFQGRSYSNVENFAVTFWVFFNYNKFYTGSVIKFDFASEVCSDNSSFGFPYIYCYYCSDTYFHLGNHYYSSETCQFVDIDTDETIEFIDFPVRLRQGFTNGWLFSGSYYDNANKLVKTFISKFGAEGQSTVTQLSSHLKTWNLVAGNYVTLQGLSNLSIKFMDVRAYFDPSSDFSLVQIWSQGNEMNNPKYWGFFEGRLKYQYSNDETRCVVSCPEGSYQFGDFCPKCPDGTYVNVDVCQFCDSAVGCETCTSATQCSTCLANKFTYESNGLQCVDNCPAETTLLDTSCIFDCSQIEGCASCSESQCLSCLDNLYSIVDQTLKCIEACPLGYYSQDSACLRCSSSCAGCFGPSNSDCEDCAESFHKIKGECSKCGEDSFYDGADCQSCASQCKTCDSSVSCLSCQEGLHLSEGTCLDKICPPGSFLSGSSCTPCSEGCALCTEADCSLCQGDIKLIKGTCVCEKGYCVEEGECRLEFTAIVDELSLKLDFMNALDPVLSLVRCC